MSNTRRGGLCGMKTRIATNNVTVCAVAHLAPPRPRVKSALAPRRVGDDLPKPMFSLRQRYVIEHGRGHRIGYFPRKHPRRRRLSYFPAQK
jgi:hypothetical protein